MIVYVLERSVDLEDISKYIVYGAVVIVALILGRWYATERDEIMAKGEPWVNSLTTKPGILIILILGGMIILKVIQGF